MVFITDSFFDKAPIDVVKYKQKRGGNMYIVKVLVEHAIYKLDTTYDYLSKYQVLAGCRVHIRFGYQQLVGYVVECQETLFTQKQLEEKNGFKYSFIQDVIDQLHQQLVIHLDHIVVRHTFLIRISKSHQFREAGNRIQRSPDLMAHIRQIFRFHLISGLGLHLRLLKA